MTNLETIRKIYVMVYFDRPRECGPEKDCGR